MLWSLVASVHNDEAVFQSTLLRSPALASAHQVFCQKGFPNVSAAYNAALRETKDDVLVFAHPDVYLPRAWSESFDKSINWLAREDPEWGVAGMFGCSQDGAPRGFAYSVGLGGFIGSPFSEPREVRTLDEFVFAVRRNSGLAFDENIPGAQSVLCTADLCLQAAKKGFRSYALPCFALHNSNRMSYLPLGYWKCYFYMRKKWNEVLTVDVPDSRITAGSLRMIKHATRGLLRRGRGHRVITRVSDPAALYEQLRKGVTFAFGETDARLTTREKAVGGPL